MAIDANSRKLSGFVLVLVAAYLVGEPVNNLFRCQLSTLNFYNFAFLTLSLFQFCRRQCTHRHAAFLPRSTDHFPFSTNNKIIITTHQYSIQLHYNHPDCIIISIQKTRLCFRPYSRNYIRSKFFKNSQKINPLEQSLVYILRSSLVALPTAHLSTISVRQLHRPTCAS